MVIVSYTNYPVCLAPYVVKAGLSLIVVFCWFVTKILLAYPETLTRTIGEKELEKLLSVINFRVFGGIFPGKTYHLCCKRMLLTLKAPRKKCI